MEVRYGMASTHSVLALDYGEKRIGVALASLAARIASPLAFIEVEKNNVIDKINELINEHEASDLVVGLPRGLNGQETEQTKKVREFVETLSSNVNIPVHLQDEAGTSLLAEQDLRVSRKKYTKGDIDSMSAALILSDWLNAHDMESN